MAKEKGLHFEVHILCFAQVGLVVDQVLSRSANDAGTRLKKSIIPSVATREIWNDVGFKRRNLRD